MSSRSIPLDLEKLEEICSLPFATFAKLGEVRREKKGGGRHIFIDRGASILAVAHLDTVVSESHFFTGVIGRKLYIFNAQLDDRLGVYLLLHTLTKMLGSTAFDVLLTEDEEAGKSTAYDFATAKNYNWMFSFDRAGTDVVMYQYDNAESEKRLKPFGLTLARGSYSCIADLEHLGVCGYNIGCGYHDNHSELAHCIWPETATMVGRFAKFYYAEKDNIHKYEPKHSRGWARHRGWGEDYQYPATISTNGHVPGVQPKALTPPHGGAIVIPQTNKSGVPSEQWSDSEWNTWLAKEEEKIALQRQREAEYANRHPEYRSERNYSCVICGGAKFAEEIQLATMTCYLCIDTYQLRHNRH